MIDNVYENDNEFECSECEYKCTSENDIINHSAIHQCAMPNEKKSLENISSYSRSTYTSEDFSDGDRREKQQNTDNINYFDVSGNFLKTEPTFYDEIPTENIDQACKLINENVKSENVEIKHEPIVNSSLRNNTTTHLNKHDLNKLSGDDTRNYNSNKKTKLDMTAREEWECEIDNRKDDKLKCPLQSNKRDLSSECLQVEKVTESPCYSKVLYLYGFGNCIEISVDNTDKYIPPGWKRRVFMNRRMKNKIIMLKCIYFTEQGLGIVCEKEADLYNKQNPFSTIEIERLDFSISSPYKLLKDLDQSLLEFDLYNNTVYIPQGWKRKAEVSFSSYGHLIYRLVYICPVGMKFFSPSEVSTYLSNNKDNVFIDISKLNFQSGRDNIANISIGNRKDEDKLKCFIQSNKRDLSSECLQIENVVESPCHSKVLYLYGFGKCIEINVDNTDKYIPPGWKRRVFMNCWMKNKMIILQCIYFTEQGLGIMCKEEAHSYNKQNPVATIEIERLDFSISSPHKLLKDLDQSLLEFDLYNNTVYIPQGWKRKAEVSFSSYGHLIYRLVYICPIGMKFYSPSEVSTYISNNKDDVFIDISKLNFHTGRDNIANISIGNLPI